MFCPKCGRILMPKAVKNKKVMACSCGYTDKDMKSATISEQVKKQDDIEIVDEEKEDTLPEIEAECPKCGNTRAKYWLVQTRAADEPETKFQKCTKCKHVWRDYS